MHLTYVYFTEFDHDSAHANQIFHTCNALVDNGHDVTLVCAGDASAYADAHELEIRFNLLSVPRICRNSTTNRIIYFFISLFVGRQTDMIFTRDISFLRVARWIPAVMRPPIVYEAHKLYSFVDELSEADERTRVAIADGVVAISHGVATDLMKLDLSVTAIVPDAATLSQIPSESKAELRHSLDITDDTELLIYSGSLSTWKNDLELLIDVFTEIAEARPSIRLYIVGGGDDLPLLRKHATKVGAPMDRLTFTGHVPQKRVFEYLGAADTGIVPLTGHDRIATQYTSPLKLYEYLVSDLKVVASDVPAITSATEGVDSVFLYTPGDQTTFSRELREALDATEPSHDPDSFSYKERATRLETVFDSVISQD